MNRAYIDISNSHAPYDAADLQGIGGLVVNRSYQSVANFRAPYDDGYFQDNDLMGVPTSVETALETSAPPSVRRFILSGEEPSALRRDIATPFNQVPRWAYAVLGVGALYLAYRGYKRWKKGS